MIPSDVVREGRVAGFPSLAEDVGEFEVGHLGLQPWEGDGGRNEVYGLGFEQVR